MINSLTVYFNITKNFLFGFIKSMRISPIIYNNQINFCSKQNNNENTCDYTLYDDIFPVKGCEYPSEYTKVKSRGKVVTQPVILLQELISNQKGYGTKAIKHVVRYSLANPKTQGRVMLYAKCIDGKTNPSGFYYKLGFRFVYDFKNKLLEQWFKNGGIRKLSPKVEGDMYLPKENIHQCLYY